MIARRIALIHATPVAMRPVHDAFAACWPEAEPVDLLESSLSSDRAAAGSLEGYRSAIASSDLNIPCCARSERHRSGSRDLQRRSAGPSRQEDAPYLRRRTGEYPNTRTGRNCRSER